MNMSSFVKKLSRVIFPETAKSPSFACKRLSGCGTSHRWSHSVGLAGSPKMLTHLRFADRGSFLAEEILPWCCSGLLVDSFVDCSPSFCKWEIHCDVRFYGAFAALLCSLFSLLVVTKRKPPQGRKGRSTSLAEIWKSEFGFPNLVAFKCVARSQRFVPNVSRKKETSLNSSLVPRNVSKTSSSIPPQPSGVCDVSWARRRVRTWEIATSVRSTSAKKKGKSGH